MIDRPPMSDPIDDEAALDRLPLPYAVVLRLDRQGVPHEIIAEAIAVEPSAVEGVLALARAKLAHAVQAESRRAR